jgi:hypothetical protein
MTTSKPTSDRIVADARGLENLARDLRCGRTNPTVAMLLACESVIHAAAMGDEIPCELLVNAIDRLTEAVDTLHTERTNQPW